MYKFWIRKRNVHKFLGGECIPCKPPPSQSASSQRFYKFRRPLEVLDFRGRSGRQRIHKIWKGGGSWKMFDHHHVNRSILRPFWRNVPELFKNWQQKGGGGRLTPGPLSRSAFGGWSFPPVTFFYFTFQCADKLVFTINIRIWLNL